MNWKQEFWQSVKSYDTEEKLDLYFYRPVGFLFAKLAKQLRLTPDIVTVAGVVVGITSGFYFYDNANTHSLLIGSILLILAGILDSSDGQLARMVGGGTKFGLVLDGLCDNLVFASVYIGSTLPLVPQFGTQIFVVAVFAGFCHSFQSAMLDFYNREYLFFGYSKSEDYWNPTVEEAREGRDHGASQSDRLLWRLRFSWLWQQDKLSTRSSEERQKLRAIVSNPTTRPVLNEAYRKYNRTMLRAWRLMGPNFHTILILLFVFLRRFELYLILGDIAGLTIALFVLRAFQRKQDQAFFGELRQAGLWK